MRRSGCCRGVHMASSADLFQSLEDLLRIARERGLSLAECRALERFLDSLETGVDCASAPHLGAVEIAPLEFNAEGA